MKTLRMCDKLSYDLKAQGKDIFNESIVSKIGKPYIKTFFLSTYKF